MYEKTEYHHKNIKYEERYKQTKKKGTKIYITYIFFGYSQDTHKILISIHNVVINLHKFRTK